MKSDKTRKWLYTAGAAASVLAPYVVPHLKEIAQAIGAPAPIIAAAGAAAIAYKAFQADPDKKQKEKAAKDNAELRRSSEP